MAKEIDWEQRAYEISKELLIVLASVVAEKQQNLKISPSDVGRCVLLSDKLVEMLKKR